jgi:hypothetical protein
MNKKTEKLYFKSVDDTICSSLIGFLDDAKWDGLEKITLIEAIPDNGNTETIWCTYYGEVGEKSECKKSICSHYSSKSGRGKCENRGNLYLHGEEVTFDVPKN